MSSRSDETPAEPRSGSSLSARYAEIDPIFSAALELPPVERAAFLDRECRGNVELRRAVERLLAASDDTLMMPAGALEGLFVGDDVTPVGGMDLAAVATLRPGTRLGPYEIVTPLGAGGMGEVYTARDPRLRRRVALKVLAQVLTSDPIFLQRFEREARAASALNHPNIVTIYDIGRQDDVAFIAMELVDGVSLRQLVNEGPLRLTKALDVAAQIADGLAAAHERGIVHRDLKPENVMVTREGRVKVLDFGLAKSFKPAPGSSEGERVVSLEVTRPGTIHGTLGYMSPEQLSGKPVDFRSDQFSFGTIFYEILTGRRAFAGKTVFAMMRALLEDPPEPVTVLRQDAPTMVGWIIDRCLAKDPHERYAHTRDLAHDLQRLREHVSREHSSGVRQVLPSDGVLTPASGVPVWSSGALTPPPEPAPRPRRGRAAAWLAAVAAFALLAGFVAGRWSERPPPASPPPTFAYLTHSGRDFSPTVSGDGALLAFASNRDGRSRIWLKQIASGTERPLTEGEDDFPRFSPDGAWVLYSHRTENGRALYRTAALGGETRLVMADAYAGDWSPDGQRIAFVRLRPEADTLWSIGTAGRDGSDVRELHQTFAAALAGPAWSPDGRWIAVTRGIAGSGQLPEVLLVSTADGTTRTLTPPAATGVLSAPAWNGDGASLLYSQPQGVRETSGTFFRQPLADGDTRAVLWHSSVGRAVAVAGDGRLIFDALALRQNLRELPLAVDGVPFAGARSAEARWLTHGSCVDRQPSYSPDGARVIFSSNRSGNLDVWEVERASGAVRRLTDHPAEDWDPSYVGDGSTILWSSNRGGHFEVWTAAADGSGARQVSRDGVNAENPTATPDGAWIVYATSNEAQDGVWKVRADGSSATRLAGTGCNLPEVSPDGRYVLYRYHLGPRGFEIRVVQLADGLRVPFVIRVEDLARPPSLDYLAGRARWLPDGRGIAFVSATADGTPGIFVQEFDPGADTTASRRQLSTAGVTTPIESFAFAADGRHLTVAGGEQSFSIVLADGVPGVAAVRRSR